MFNTLKTTPLEIPILSRTAQISRRQHSALQLENPGSMASVREEIQQTKTIWISRWPAIKPVHVELCCPEDVMELRTLRLIPAACAVPASCMGFLQDDRALPCWIPIVRRSGGVGFCVTDNGIGMRPEALCSSTYTSCQVSRREQETGAYRPAQHGKAVSPTGITGAGPHLVKTLRT